MVQAVIRLSVTAKAEVRFRFNLCGICGGLIGIGKGFASSTSVFHCHFYSAVSHIHTGVRRLATFRSTTDRIYDGGPVIL
jgi:hypothetical protein